LSERINSSLDIEKNIMDYKKVVEKNSENSSVTGHVAKYKIYLSGPSAGRYVVFPFLLFH